MVPEPRPLQSKEILKKIRLEVIKFISVCLSLIFSISVLIYGIIQSKNSAKYGSGMGLHGTRIVDPATARINTDKLDNMTEDLCIDCVLYAGFPDIQSFDSASTQMELPGVFRNVETLQKYLLGFVRDLQEPDKAEDDYKNWLEDLKNGKIDKDVKKTIAEI